MYRSTIRPKLRSWVDEMVGNANEWLILYVPIGTRAPITSGSGTLSLLRGTASDSTGAKVYKKIYDKIRGEFYHKREGDRSFKVEMFDGANITGAAPGQQSQNDSQWTELLLRLRDGVMASFERKSIYYENEAKKLENQVDHPTHSSKLSPNVL